MDDHNFAGNLNSNQRGHCFPRTGSDCHVPPRLFGTGPLGEELKNRGCCSSGELHWPTEALAFFVEHPCSWSSDPEAEAETETAVFYNGPNCVDMPGWTDGNTGCNGYVEHDWCDEFGSVDYNGQGSAESACCACAPCAPGLTCAPGSAHSSASVPIPVTLLLASLQCFIMMTVGLAST